MHAQLSFSYVFMKFSNRIVIFFSLSIVTFGYFSFQSCSNLSGFIKKVKTEEISTVLIDNLQDSYQIHQWQKHWCSENEQLLNSSGMICKLHELDPWDPSLKKFFAQTSRNFHCLEVQPSLTYLDDQNFLHINESEYKLVVGNGSLVCEYQTFERLHDDKQLIFHERKILEKVNKY